MKWRRYRILYLMLAPVLLYYFLFSYVPIHGLLIAFKDYNVFDGVWGSSWVGLDVFRDIMSDDYFWQTAGNTVMISMYKIVFGFPLPIILALMLNEMLHLRTKRVIQTIIYLPHFISWVIIGGLVIAFLSPSTGVINHLIALFGGEPIYFMLEQSYFRSIVVLSDIWKNVGWGTIIYIAAIASVNPELYEAAVMDGAGKGRQAWHITLPGIRSIVVMMFILAISGILNAGFDQIFVLYNPLVMDVGDIIDTYVYRTGLQNAKYSYATAIGLFKSVIGFALILLADRLAKQFGERGII
ncbi:protein lplB [Paenibacillus sp. 598K]|uniref:ABC transporter permease n=1 Tax=Paenibacillus sp. 598K TaxID=1117987 RepID=UPI000FFAEFEB|nr:ABC transporter permease subunit [Paenibacillus sp. 598K]GBF72451.1 protein lplB [Paenibacillus sp. 598K]